MIVRVVLACWLLAVGLLLAAPPGHARPQPNLVLILADDLGYGELGAYGGRGSPPPTSTPWRGRGRCSPTATRRRPCAARAGPHC